MEKLKSLSARLPPLSSSTPGNKLSKAFRFNKHRGITSRDATGDPFMDGPRLEEPSLPRVHLVLHCFSMFFSFLALCTNIGVAAFQAKWIKVSGGTGFTLFLLILTFLLSMFLLTVPLIYDRWDRLKRVAQFLQQTRSRLILHAFGAGLMVLSAFIVTISAWTEKGCKNPQNDPHASLGDDFTDGLKQWCQTKKASAIFDWLSFGAWLALLVLTALVFRRERQREPAFIPPSSPSGYHRPLADAEMYDGNIAAAQAAPYSPPMSMSSNYHYSRPAVVHVPSMNVPAVVQVEAYNPAPLARQSADGYAYSGGGKEEPSRTMQLAYTDPYAHIRQSLMGGTTYSPVPTAGYRSNLPNPPTYGGYR